MSTNSGFYDYPSQGGGPSSGQTEDQVKALIANAVAEAALKNNATKWSAAKVTFDSVAAYNAVKAMLVGSLGSSAFDDTNRTIDITAGTQGVQGGFWKRVFIDVAKGTSVSAPSARQYNLDTDSFSGLTNTWSETAPTSFTPNSRDYYYSEVWINPSQASTLTSLTFTQGIRYDDADDFTAAQLLALITAGDNVEVITDPNDSDKVKINITIAAGSITHAMLGTGIVENDNVADSTLTESKFAQAVKDKLNSSGSGGSGYPGFGPSVAYTATFPQLSTPNQYRKVLDASNNPVVIANDATEYLIYPTLDELPAVRIPGQELHRMAGNGAVGSTVSSANDVHWDGDVITGLGNALYFKLSNTDNHLMIAGPNTGTLGLAVTHGIRIATQTATIPVMTGSSTQELFNSNVNITAQNTIVDLPGLITATADIGDDHSFLIEAGQPLQSVEVISEEVTGKQVKLAGTIANNATGNHGGSSFAQLLVINRNTGVELGVVLLVRKASGQWALQISASSQGDQYDPMPLRVTRRIFGTTLDPITPPTPSHASERGYFGTQNSNSFASYDYNDASGYADVSSENYQFTTQTDASPRGVLTPSMHWFYIAVPVGDEPTSILGPVSENLSAFTVVNNAFTINNAQGTAVNYKAYILQNQTDESGYNRFVVTRRA